MLQFLTLENYAGYDLEKLPSENPQGGGMSMKWARIEALCNHYFIDYELNTAHDGISDDAGLVMDVDYVYHLWRTGGFEAFMDWLVNRQSRTVLMCTTRMALRMPKNVLVGVVNECSAVGSSCKFVQRLLRYHGVSSQLFVDPILDSYSENAVGVERENRVIATGQISWFKNTRQVIDVFTALKDSPIRTMYVGGAGFWSNHFVNDSSMSMQHELERICDEYIEEATESEFAKLLYGSRFGLWCAWHDCSAYSLFEMMYAGVIPVCVPHGLADDLDVRTFDSADKMAEAILELSDEDTSRESEALSVITRKRSGERSFLDQLRKLLS